jgi:hypothetical protein
MLVARAVLQPLLKHRHLGPERLVVKSSVHLICVFLSNGSSECVVRCKAAVGALPVTIMTSGASATSSDAGPSN